MSAITTHVLDAMLGQPARHIPIDLEKQSPGGWQKITSSSTDIDGRCKDLCANAYAGIYRLTFHTRPYFDSQHRTSIYPEITITFAVDGMQHYHIPLLLSDNSYTTYRGS